MQTASSSLAVPIILWGNRCPTHCISSILISPQQDVCVTGSHDGQMCLWNLKSNTFKATPSRIFVGHTRAVTCLAWLSPAAKSFFSCSEAGEMSLWDLDDSSCTEAVTSGFVHTMAQAYNLVGRRSGQIFCNGYYPDIMVYDAASLSLLFRLSSKINSDWITSVIVMKPAQSADDVVVGLSLSGSMKVWTIPPDFNGQGREFIFENESKQLRVQNAWTLKSCPTFPRTMLIVSPTTWQIYDAGDFSLLCSTHVPKGLYWGGGDFLNTEQVVIYATDGTAYLYRLPANSDANNQQFRRTVSTSEKELGGSLFGILKIPNATPLSCEPSWTIFRSASATGEYPFHVTSYVIRGDARGRISVWAIPEYTKDQLTALINSGGEVTEHAPFEITSMDAEWDRLTRRQPGIIDRAEFDDGGSFKITSSLYVSMHGRMFLGMEDGAIIMLPLMQKLCIQFFIGKKTPEMPVYRILRGHEGKVTALLYPHQDDPRYDPGMLISGGIDFTVRVWDLYQCHLQHTFVCQAGEILQLLTPPSGCNTRVLNSICSIASDHSVALLSLKERKAIMMASRHVFPIQAVKWRPVDDFLLVQCSDGTVYVWQMETGHLDRVVQGSAAEDIMKACDEQLGEAGGFGEDIAANPTLHLFRALKHRNMDAARQAAKLGLKNMSAAGGNSAAAVEAWAKGFGCPLTVQAVRSNSLDQENHLLLFDVEALILQLLAEENRGETSDPAKATPRMEPKTGSDWKSTSVIPGAASVTGGAEAAKPAKHIAFAPEGMSMAMEVAQILISLLYAWGLDHEMDKLCVEKLGMLQPKQAVNYGIMSKTGFMTLLLPTPLHRKSIELPQPQERIRDMLSNLTRNHWSLSSTLTTVHLMTIVSVANTLMNIQNATFHQDYEKRRKLHKRLVRMDTSAVTSSGLPDATQGLGGYTTSDVAQTFVEQQALIKQTWSQLTAMHCVLLSERLGYENYKPPDVEILIRRWQDRCLEIRTGAQALILSELRRMGTHGRRRLIERWAVYLPNFQESEKPPVFEVRPMPPPVAVAETPASENAPEAGGDDDFEDLQNDPLLATDPNLPSIYSVEYRKKQSVAILLLGIIGAEFGAETLSPVRTPTGDRTPTGRPDNLQFTDPVIRLVGKALSYIVVNQDEKLQPYSSLRRSAVDLLGRGFVVWEPFLDVGHVLLSLLRLTLDVERPPANLPASVPLTPAADMARAARQALDMIASARPPVFITVTNMEITRHNSLIQSAQTLNINLNNAVIVRAKEELLRTLDLLINKNPQSVADLIVEVIDVVIHCLDPGRIKNSGLVELFPPIGRFPMVAYCKQNRRVAVGSKKGGVFIYELRGMKVQSYSGHGLAVAAIEFAPDGKHFASFSLREGKLLFWQIGATLFGLGSTQPRCVKTCKANTVLWQNWPELKEHMEYRLARLRWITNKDVLCMLINGKEEKFSL
ncbi:WD repeat-containing protein 7-like isoform X2 [Paramacrobiotus metropolitanus]|uniref:WD repeat-containing protein 7-like isoform X2 n=1 Tax=Paramacrobiotus metropolitanus TaxID=2943436 RepID=UPI0024459492|nr:WD repeat-containing protein 7-like isoform X2 [Paramacrobiotus metropolitanus]